MSNATKFSYGIQLSKTAGKAKADPPKRKAIFGDDDDDVGANDDAKTGRQTRDGPVEEAITELGDDFLSAAAPVSSERQGRKRPLESRKKASLPLPPAHRLSSKHKAGADFDGDLSTALSARKYTNEAEALDPSVYDYDASYDAFKAAAKKLVPGEGAGDDDNGSGAKKAQYMTNVRKMAEVRERDRRMAEDKKMQRERAAEGDAFADKETFVTEAYKQQQVENRRLEEEERRREEEEERKAAARGGGMTGFYQQLLDRDEQQQAAIAAALREKKEGKPSTADAADAADAVDNEPPDSAATAREMNARGGTIAVNDEGEVVDKRELLRGGLNISARKRADLQRERERRTAQEAQDRENGRDREPRRGAGSFAVGSKQAMRDRQTRMLEAQYEQVRKRTHDEDEDKVKAAQEAAKTRKTAVDISSAKERYLARKRAEAEEKKATGGP